MERQWVIKVKNSFEQDKPIYLQVREKIEDLILNNQLKEGEQSPSTNQLVNLYKINHVTISKGINQLVDEGILYKKRGIGMFVAEGAKEKLIQQRKETFIDDFIVKLVHEANKLDINEAEIIEYIKNVKGREKS